MFVLLAVLVFVPSVVCHDNQWLALKFGATSDDYIGPFRYDMSPFRDSLSICMWVKRVHTSASYPIVFDYEPSTPNNEILLASNGYYNRIAADTSLDYLVSKFTTPTGTWYHYCITYSPSSGIRLYLDGDLIGTVQGPGRSLKMGGTLFFNRLSYDTGSSFIFGGELYQFNLFSGVLSATSVKKIAQGGLCFDLEEFSATRVLRWEEILEKPRSGNVINVKVCDPMKELEVRLRQTQEMLANAVGQLDETQGQLETVIGQFNSTVDELRVTKDELNFTKENFESVAKELNSTKKYLGAMVKDFNSAKDDLGAIANEFNCAKDLGAKDQELNSTKEALGAMAKQLNSTQEALGAMEKELNSAKNDFGVVRTELDKTEAQLEEETARHNKTEELLQSCSATLKDYQNDSENARPFHNITRWDVLYTKPYFNNQFTDELYEKLTTTWEMLRKFVGVNMTEGIIEHFRQYHQDPDCESMEQFSPSMYEHFRGVQRTEGIVAHLMDHMFPPNSECNDEVKDN